MDNEFLANIQQEGKVNLSAESEREEKETPPESPAETKPTEDEPASKAEEGVKDAPPLKENEPAVFHAFHEHPRWRQMNEELDSLRAFKEEVAPLLEELRNKPKAESGDIPGWFVTLYGNNEQAWKEYSAQTNADKKALKEEIISAIRQEEANRTQETKKLDKWVEDSISELKAKGYKFEQNELLKVAIDYAPTDEEGNISLEKAYQILQGIKGQSKLENKANVTAEKKAIADKTIGKGGANEEKQTFKTSEDFRGKSFADIGRG